MVSVQPKAQKNERPWEKYLSDPDGKLLIPGWAGSLDSDEVSYIQEKLKADAMLSYWWGFRPGQRTRSVSAIERVAWAGSPEVRSENVKLTRLRNSPAVA